MQYVFINGVITEGTQEIKQSVSDFLSMLCEFCFMLMSWDRQGLKIELIALD